MSVKNNFFWNLLLTSCNYIFPLITYPYVSRVLGVDKIGICNFVDGIITYFILLSTLGITSYGVREIARVKNDEQKRNYVFSNLIVINAIGTLVASLSLIVCTYTIPSLAPYKDFLFVGLVKLVFYMFTIEWFFQGMEQFRYITIVSISIRCIYVVLVFLLVHSPNDAIIYFGLTVLTSLLTAAFNWYYSRKSRRIILKDLNIRVFLIPVLTFGYYRILTSMYTTFNVVFLGFSANDTEVGYFTTATKLYSIIMGVFTAFTTVMIPRVSELLSFGEKEQLQRIYNQTIQLLVILSLPIIFYCLFCTEDIIFLLSGKGYEGAFIPFKIVIVLLLIIGMEQIVIQQFLMAATSSNYSIVKLSTVGAVVGILFNIVLTPSLGAIGSSISWGVSEISVLILGLYFLKMITGIHFNVKQLSQDFIWALLYIPVLFLVRILNLGVVSNLLLSALSLSIVFVTINFLIRKNEILCGMSKTLLSNLNSLIKR